MLISSMDLKVSKFSSVSFKFTKGVFVILFLLYATLHECFAKDIDETDVVTRLTGRAAQFYHQKKYDKSILILERVLKKYPQNKSANFYYNKSNEKLIRAMIIGKQAVILLSNGQHLLAKNRVLSARQMAPYSKVIEDLANHINRELKKLRPLTGLSKAKRERLNKLINSGNKDLDEGRNLSAASTFKEALQIAPKSPEAIKGYNLALIRSHEVSDRDKSFKLLQKARKLADNKKYYKAKNMYEEIISFDPANSRAISGKKEMERLIQDLSQRAEKSQLAEEYYQTGKSQVNKKKFPAGIEQYELGKGILPGYKNWDKLIAEAERLEKEYGKQDLKQKLRAMDKHFERGFFRFTNEEYAKAISEFESVIAIAKEYNAVKTGQNAIELLKKSQENLRKKEEEIVNEISPYYKMVNTLKILGLNAYKQKKYNIAKDYFFSILELFPKNRFAKIYFAKCELEINPDLKPKIFNEYITSIKDSLKARDKSEAKRLLRISTEIFPNNKELISFKKKLGKNRIIGGDPSVSRSTVNSWYKQALSAAQRDPKKSITILDKLIKADPTHLKARSLQARLEGRVKSRVRIRVNPQAQKLFSEGMWHYSHGRIKKAITSFQSALRIEPGYKKAKRALNKCKVYLSGA